MTIIELETKIASDIHVVFDLARSIDLHIESTAGTGEEAIAGKTSGLISIHESVTWRAKHFGIRLQHQSYIPNMSAPVHFTDEMTKGAFTSFRHDHYFSSEDGMTLMKDVLRYEVPFGFAGRMFDKLILKKYLTKFISGRNHVIKVTAEGKMQRSD
jgi:ligand-binding SRPBCC domain-containing protein